MRKTLFSLIAAVFLAAVMITSALAATPVEGLEHCYFNYVCNKATAPVTADGVYHEEEWSDAAELLINKDTMQDFGRWQSTGEPNPADEFCLPQIGPTVRPELRTCRLAPRNNDDSGTDTEGQ